MSPNRALCSALLVATAGATTLIAPASASAGEDPPTCNGQPATIVGGPDEDVTGTARDDVIYTVDSFTVTAGAGDDLICAVNQSYRLSVKIEAGAGDDYVEGLSDIGHMDVDLGEGSDTFRSSSSNDTIVTDGPTSELDTVEAGGLGDRVISGVRGQPNPDRIDLGPGKRDVLEWSGTTGFPVGTKAALDGGDGSRDVLRASAEEVLRFEAGSYGWMSADGGSANLVDVGGFERVRLRGARIVDYYGSSRVDNIVLNDVRRAKVDLKGGPDRLVAERTCVRRVSGDAGADRIQLRTSTCVRRSRAFGGRGDDRLHGSQRSDSLAGGPGRDLADGGGGYDRCVAEVRRHCESG